MTQTGRALRGPLREADLIRIRRFSLLELDQMQSPAEAGLNSDPGSFLVILGTRIQRNSKAESLLSSCALGPLKCPSNFSRWRFFPSKSF
jgi:hypothetical protein